MRPVEITTVDRVINALVLARAHGQLQAGEPVVDCLPVHAWDNHVFAAQAADGTLTPLIKLAFNEPLPADYHEALQRKGFPLRALYGSSLTLAR